MSLDESHEQCGQAKTGQGQQFWDSSAWTAPHSLFLKKYILEFVKHHRQRGIGEISKFKYGITATQSQTLSLQNTPYFPKYLCMYVMEPGMTV